MPRSGLEQDVDALTTMLSALHASMDTVIENTRNGTASIDGIIGVVTLVCDFTRNHGTGMLERLQFARADMEREN